MLVATDIQTNEYKEYILGEVLGFDKSKENTTDYYAKNDGQAPFENSFRFAGKGCESFGYSGSFEEQKKVFKDLFDGKDPRTKPPKQKYLVKNWRDEDRRIGTDLTWSAPKSVSVALASAQASGDTKLAEIIVEAHREAVRYAYGEMEKNAVCRKGAGGIIKEKGVKLFGCIVDHNDTRPTLVDGVPLIDCQLHSHLISFNFALCRDGRTRAIEALSMSKQIKASGALYKAKLAEQLQKHGLSISNERISNEFGITDQTKFSLNGVSDKAQELFSKRSQTIFQYMQEHNLPPERIKEAVLATRLEKNGATNEATIATWKQQIEEQLEPEDIDLYAQHNNKLHDEVSNEKIVDMVVDFKKSTRISKFDILEIVTQIYIGHENSLEKIHERTEIILNDENLICKHAKLDAVNEFVYTSMKLAKDDLSLRNIARKSVNSKKHKLHGVDVHNSILKFEKQSGYPLSKEQEQAIRNLTSGPDMSVFIGRAGTGKTTSACAVVDAYKSQGYTAIGTAVANEASIKLQAETGMESVSVAKLLSQIDSKRLNITDRHLIYVDESSMLDLPTTAKLAGLQARTGCRMVFAGDADQLSSVGVGSGLRVLIEELNPSEIKEIRRQKKNKHKALANDFYSVETKKQSQDLWKKLKDENMIFGCNNAYSAVEELAESFTDDKREMKDKLAMATTNNGVTELNIAIQNKLINKGLLSKNIICKRQDYTYREGDPVRFNQSVKFKKEGQQTTNGTTGIVIDDGSGLFRVKLENGATVTIKDDVKAIALNYAKTVDKSQGQSIDSCFLLCDSKINRNKALVAYTRMKEEFKIFGETKFLEEVKNNLHSKNDESGVFHLLDEQTQQRVINMIDNNDEQERTKELYTHAGLSMSALAGLTDKMATHLASGDEKPLQEHRESFDKEFFRQKEIDRKLEQAQKAQKFLESKKKEEKKKGNTFKSK